MYVLFREKRTIQLTHICLLYISGKLYVVNAIKYNLTSTLPLLTVRKLCGFVKSTINKISVHSCERWNCLNINGVNSLQWIFHLNHFFIHTHIYLKKLTLKKKKHLDSITVGESSLRSEYISRMSLRLCQCDLVNQDPFQHKATLSCHLCAVMRQTKMT